MRADEVPDAAISDWTARLADGAADDATWARFDDQPDALRITVAQALKARVDDLNRNSPPAAIPVAEALVRAARDLPELLPLALRGRGACAHFNGDRATAQADFETAVDLYLGLDRPLDAARALRSLIDVHQMSGRSHDAIACARRATALAADRGDPHLLAQISLNLGNVYTRLDEYTAATEHYHAARAGFETAGDTVYVAFADFNLAVVAMNANRCDEAERNWREARAGMDAAGMGMLVADCDYNLAYLESRQGRFESAIEGLDRARVAYRQNGKPSGIPLCDLDLAEIQLRLGTLRDALRNATLAAQAFDGLEMPYEQARAEVLAGIARARLGDAPGALNDLARAEERFMAQGNEAFAAFVGLQRAQVDLARGRAAETIDGLRSRRATLLSRGTVWLADMAALTLARALVMAQRPEESLHELAALRRERPEGSQLGELLEAIALRLEADALAACGRRDEALATLRRAVTAIDATWARVPSGDVRIAFFRDQHPAFVDLAFLLLDAGRADEALAVFEHGRSRSLLETSPLDRNPLWKAERERLEWLLARQLDAELGPLVGGTELRHERNLAVDWRGEIDQARDRLAHLALDDRSGGDAPAQLDPLELTGACRGDELLLVYMCGRPGVRLLALEAGDGGLSVEAIDLGLAAHELIELREQFLFHLARRRLGASAVRRLHAVLRELGERLLSPVADRLAGPDGPRPLVVVPYGPLHDLPVHAFELAGRPLAQAHEVSQAVSVWHLARQRAWARSPRGPAVGYCAGASLDVLPAIEQEIAALQDVFGERITRLSSDALVDGLQAGSLSGSLLHIAAHGRFETRKPRFSAVCVGHRFLLAHDVATLSLDLDLVTLSGCETGRKGYTGGDELMGLPRALLGAGVRGVLGSLWPVRDDDAATFMHSFYESFATGRSARRSLADAQRAMLEHHDDPLAWAAFSLLGDPDVALPPGPRTPSRTPSSPRMSP